MSKLKYTRTKRKLTDAQREFIKTNWLVLSDISMAKYLETTEGAIRKLRHTMGLNKQKIKKYKTRIPLIVWMPRDSYKDFERDCTSIGIEELVPNDR